MNRYLYAYQNVKPIVHWFEVGDMWRNREHFFDIVEISRNTRFAAKFVQYRHRAFPNRPDLTMVIKIDRFLKEYERVNEPIQQDKSYYLEPSRYERINEPIQAA